MDKVVAVVNDSIITHSEIETAAKMQPTEGVDQAALRTQVLNQLIQEELIQQEIDKASIVVTEPKVDAAIADILTQNGMTEDQLMEALKGRGMSKGAYREEVKQQLERLELVNMKVRSKVTIPESVIREEYEAEIRKEGKQTMVSIRHLFFGWDADSTGPQRQEKIALAQEARARTMRGEAFHLVAMEVSEGPTAENGGSLGEIQEDQLMPELASTVHDMKVGEISEPIVTSTGVHVVKVDSRRATAGEDFSAAKPRIQQKLYQKAFARQMKLWVDELRARGSVEIIGGQ